MKRISLFCLLALLAGATICSADDAAVEERLNKLGGQIEDLLAAAARQDKRISALERELENVREQAAKPSGNYASHEDLRRLADKLQEIDRNRVADSEKFVKAIEQLGKASPTGTSGPRRPSRPTETTPSEDLAKHGTGGSTGSEKNEKGFEYVIASGDSFSTIAQAYREKGVKITSEQIAKANPTLKPNSLKVGQKVFIPAQ